jgi:hypothetical protein
MSWDEFATGDMGEDTSRLDACGLFVCECVCVCVCVCMASAARVCAYECMFSCVHVTRMLTSVLKTLFRPDSAAATKMLMRGGLDVRRLHSGSGNLACATSVMSRVYYTHTTSVMSRVCCTCMSRIPKSVMSRHACQAYHKFHHAMSLVYMHVTAKLVSECDGRQRKSRCLA